MNKYREALEEMVWQFAYRDVKDGISVLRTGGLSALEFGFAALGWPDPYVWTYDGDGIICDVKDCAGWVCVQGGVWEPGYWMICSSHHDAWLKKQPKPEMKQRAIDREAKRDPVTGRLSLVAREGCEGFR